MYPLKFDPIYQYRLWGGRRLSYLLSKPLPKDEPIGEAWLLSDREDCASIVLEGTFKGYSLTQLLKYFPKEIMGDEFILGNRFPLLLKFLDCKDVLSVQVHPSDHQNKYLPKGDSGKTEAWIVLETNEDSRIYAGLKRGTTKKNLLASIEDSSTSELLHSFIPTVGDGIYIPSGTVHTLGGTLVFEVQENSDVTFRLYDWDRKDVKTGKPRELHIDQAIDCIDFNQINIEPVIPIKDPEFKHTKKLFDNNHFILWRIKTEILFTVGIKDELAILVCIKGNGTIAHNDHIYTICKGEVMLLPASLGQLKLKPESEIELFQIAIPADSLKK